jgi:hypothetical protein
MPLERFGMDGNPSERFALLRESAFKTVTSKYPNLARENQALFIKEVCNEFIIQQVQSFPEMCDVARVQNAILWNDIKKNGKQGKYTGSYGWSENGDFCFKYDVPQDLYLFMQNLVYKDFWDDSNKKVREKFMQMVLRGDDPERILIWTKGQYGSNKQEGIVN